MQAPLHGHCQCQFGRGVDGGRCGRGAFYGAFLGTHEQVVDQRGEFYGIGSAYGEDFAGAVFGFDADGIFLFEVCAASDSD